MKVRSIIYVFSLLSAFAFFACTKFKKSDRAYHPIEKYIYENSKLGLNNGRMVAIVINSNGCHQCSNQANEIVINANQPSVKLIYSIEHKRLADMNIVEASEEDTVNYFIDYKNTPFRKGIVQNNAIVYFLSDGLMVDSTKITVDIQKRISDFIQPDKQL